MVVGYQYGCGFLLSDPVIMEGEKCVFNFKYQCKSGSCSKNCDRSRIDTIIHASKLYKDNLHELLEPQLAVDPNLTIHYHIKIVCLATPLQLTFPSMLNHPNHQLRSFADHTQHSISQNIVSIVVRNVTLSRILNTLIDGGKHTHADQQYLQVTTDHISNTFWTFVVINEMMNGVMKYKYVQKELSVTYMQQRLGITRTAIPDLLPID